MIGNEITGYFVLGLVSLMIIISVFHTVMVRIEHRLHDPEHNKYGCGCNDCEVCKCKEELRRENKL